MGAKMLSGVEIACRLRLQGWTQAALAKEIGVSDGIVNNVIHNRATCHRVAMRIAELLGNGVQELWPGRYEFKPRATKAKQDQEEEGKMT